MIKLIRRLLDLATTKLQTRIILGVAVMLFPLIALMLGVFTSYQSTIGYFEDVAIEMDEEIEPALILEKTILEAVVPVNDPFVIAFPAEQEAIESLYRKVEQAFAVARAAPYGLNAERELILQALEEWQQASALSRLVMEEQSGQKIDNEQARERFQAHIAGSLYALDQLQELAREEIDERLAQSQDVKQRVLLMIISMFLVGFCLVIVVAVILARSILRPLAVLAKGANCFSQKDFTYRVEVNRRDELGELAQVFNMMAKNLAENQQKLEYISTHDELTGLYNNREFYRWMQQEVERSHRYGHPVSLLMLDLDHFKAVNDNYGHLAGDEVLRNFATLLLSVVRPADHVARYGGEEFAIILIETPADGAAIVAERIRQATAVKKYFVVEGEVITVTVSIGVASLPADAATAEELVALADEALYAAKKAGRNRVCSAGDNH